jgi:fucose permease
MLDRVAFAGMFVFGIVMALLGAVMPVLVERLSLGLDQVGFLFLVTNGAMLAASLIVGLGGLLSAAAVLCVGSAIWAAALRFPAPKQAQGWPLADIRRFARMPLVLMLALLLFFQSGNEFVLGGYFSTFLTTDLAVPVVDASYLLAAYWAAIMAARVMLSRVLGRFGARRIVLGGALLAAAGAGIVATAPTAPLAAAGILLTGLALAGIFPTVLGIAGAAFRDHSGTVFGILFTVALTGGMTMPWLAGHLAAGFGLRAVFMLAAVNFAAIATLASLAWRARSA